MSFFLSTFAAAKVSMKELPTHTPDYCYYDCSVTKNLAKGEKHIFQNHGIIYKVYYRYGWDTILVREESDISPILVRNASVIP